MKQLRSRLGAVTLTLLMVISMFAVVAPVSAQASSATEIDSCTTISEPGRYVLTTDIEDSTERECIVIDGDAENVTLDGDGHTIDGTETGVAILAGESTGGDAANVVITDVVITGWGSAIVYDGVSGGAIRDSIIRSNYAAIQLGFFTEDIEVTDNTIVDNRRGISTFFATDNVFENNTVSDSERSDYTSEGDRFEEGVSSATVRDLRLETATVSFEEDIETGGMLLLAAQSLPDDPEDRQNIGQYVDVTGTSEGECSLTFGMHYTEADVEQAGVDEDSLRLYRFADGEWTELPGSTVDTDANIVTTSVDNLSVLGTESVVAPLGESAGNGEGSDGKDGGDGDGTNGDGSASDGDKDGDAKNGGSDSCRDVTVGFEGITISDLDLAGPGLSDMHIDERTYEIGEFDVDVDGVTVTIDGKDHTVGCVSITVEPFTVTLEDITLGAA